ncbi:MAG: DNA primase [Bacteroidales bacterium]|nr:DNA primase [Bacteroidales bacterium]
MIKRETIDAIVSACRIEEVVGDFVHLTKRGVNLIGLCPFHDEKTPSFNVSPARGIYKCFGCGEAGNAIRFVMQYEKCTYVEALRYLAKKYGITVEETERTPEAIRQMNEREALMAVSEFAASFFSDNLWKSTEGRNIGLSYFHERGFTDETIMKFRLGYSLSNRTALLDKAVNEGYTADNLEKAGLVLPPRQGEDDRRYDRFYERVMFPIQNFSGRVIAFGGRTLRSGDKKIAKYVNSPETEIYHKSDTLYGIFQARNAIRKADKCLLVEGYADVISMHQAGIENVVASSGTSLTANQVRLIRKLTNNVTVVYDGDAAGIHAAERAVGMMLKEGLDIRIVTLPPEDDPDSFARSHSLQEIEEYIANGERDFLKFRIDRFLQQPDHDDPLKKAAFIRAVAEDLALIPDSITLSVFVRQSSEMLEVSEDVLLSAVNKIRVRRYVEEKQRQSAPAEQEAAEALVPEPSREKPVPDTPAFLTIADVERALLFRLVNYGDRMLVLEQEGEEPRIMRLDEMVFNDLEQDQLELETTLYHKFYNMYKEAFLRQPETVLQQLQYSQDEEVLQLYTALQDVKPAYSSGWKQRKSIIHTIDDQDELLREDLLDVLHNLRLMHLRKMKEECELALKTEQEEEEMLILLSKIRQINEYITIIEKKLGVTYR